MNFDLKLLYISDAFVSLSVFQSQVHTLCNFHSDFCEVSVISMCNHREIAASYPENIKYTPIKTYKFPKSFIPAMGKLNAVLALLKKQITDSFKQSDVIHCRGHIGAYFGISVLKMLGIHKPLIADIRGEICEEFRLKGGIKGKFFWQQSKRLERFVFKYSDFFFFVSDEMRKYYVQQYDISAERCTVFPTIVNDNLFKKDEQVRQAVRKELKIEDKYVYIYVGGVDVWQNVDKIIKKFAEVSTLKEKLHLLLILTNPAPIRKYIEQHNISMENITILSVPYDDVAKYLNAADAGIIIRDWDNIINKVASPTKINEYLACGLKIIDRLEGIGDFTFKTKRKYHYIPVCEVVEKQQDIYRKLASHRSGNDI